MKPNSMQYRIWLFLKKQERPLPTSEIAAGLKMPQSAAIKACVRISKRYGAIANVGDSRYRGARWQIVPGVDMPNLQRGGNFGHHKRANPAPRQSNAACGFTVPECLLERVWRDPALVARSHEVAG